MNASVCQLEAHTFQLVAPFIIKITTLLIHYEIKTSFGIVYVMQYNEYIEKATRLVVINVHTFVNKVHYYNTD